MQYVNDDMDELFRRAAKDYPLNTTGADWEKVQKTLDEPPAPGERPSNRSNRRQFLWLLLLLPLPWICTRYSGEGEKGSAAETSVPQTRTEKAERYAPAPVPPNSSGAVLKSSSAASISSFTAFSAPVNMKSHTVGARAIKRDNDVLSDYSPHIKSTGEISKEPSSMQENKAEAAPGVSSESISATGESEQDSAAAPEAKDTSAAEPPVKKAQQLPKTKRFYVGVIGGADVTSIEMQKVKKVGYDLGIVAGYSINNRWSVEGGLLSSEKAYYSSGEHLYKAYVLPGTKLREAEGDCRMWEVPLAVRYRFNPERQGGWFASVGTSSYFMKKESYDYTYYYTATGQELKRSRSYDSDSRHLFAAAQLSGGYTRRLGRSMDIRIEPYLKLPLRKVGYYELPLTSVGVHVGITKRLY